MYEKIDFGVHISEHTTENRAGIVMTHIGAYLPSVYSVSEIFSIGRNPAERY